MNAHVLAGVWVRGGWIQPRGLAQLTGRKDRQKKETSLFTMPPHLHRGNLSTRISTQGLGSADFYFLPHTLCCLCYSHTQPKHVNFPHARNRTDYSQILVFLIGEILLLKLFHLKLFGERSTEIKSTTTSKDIQRREAAGCWQEPICGTWHERSQSEYQTQSQGQRDVGKTLVRSPRGCD